MKMYENGPELSPLGCAFMLVVAIVAVCVFIGGCIRIVLWAVGAS